VGGEMSGVPNLGVLGLLILSGPLRRPDTAHAAEEQVTRGKYLVELGSCGHCHTPGHFLGRLDTTRLLAGSDVGLQGPMGEVVVGRNLTPDNDTGIGRWTVAQIVTAITSGVRPDGRVLSPLMPWAEFHSLRATDAVAIALYLKSLPPIRNQVPGPFAAHEKVPLPRVVVVPADNMREVSR
jgi:mono/diheme cytochrome c family protein